MYFDAAQDANEQWEERSQEVIECCSARLVMLFFTERDRRILNTCEAQEKLFKWNLRRDGGTTGTAHQRCLYRYCWSRQDVGETESTELISAKAKL